MRKDPEEEMDVNGTIIDEYGMDMFQAAEDACIKHYGMHWGNQEEYELYDFMKEWCEEHKRDIEIV